MKKIIFAALLFMALVNADGAFAQSAIFNWSGFYAGANAGYGWGNVRDSVTNSLSGGLVLVEGPVTFKGNASGFVGGLHGGYNYQVNNFVYGLDASWSWTDVERRKACNSAVPGSGDLLLEIGADCMLSERIDALGDFRLRAGFAFGRSHFYFAGGYAVADISASFAPDAVAKADGAVNVRNSGLQSGWTIGAGIEHALSDNLILGLDYKYYDFGDWHHAGFGGSGGTVVSTISNNVHITDNILQLRLSYKFGTP